MATQVSTIIDAAIASSTANDGGASPIANNRTELIGVLDRKIQQVYSLVALPRDRGGAAAGDFFKTTWTIVVADPSDTLVALPTDPVLAFIHQVVDDAGNNVAIVPFSELQDDLAEFPPGIVIMDQKFRSCARAGDPVASDELTIYGSYLPARLTSDTDYVGATTLADADTTTWPSEVGDPFLVAYLGLYLAMKDGSRDATEIQHYQNEMQVSATILADLLSVNASVLISTSEK